MTMSRPVSQPLVSSWKKTTIAYDVQNDRRVTTRVRSSTRSTTSATRTPPTASAV
jgi:hypothetical protein